MKGHHHRHRWVIGVLFLLAGSSHALEVDVRGQLSGWTIESRIQDEWQNQSGARYIPQLTLNQMITDEAFLDLEVSANGFVAYDQRTDETDSDVELYRLKLRFATAQTETRLGLQKINFGPGRLLRSLRWFDQLDQRDPLQLTDGVYALLYRYTALNNANLWLWGLYGNNELKGFERLVSVEDKPEFGGRLQYPVFNGELAATAHTRTVDGSGLKTSDFTETRVALDGRWEKGIGMWFESILQQQDTDQVPYEWATMTTLGIDYTFGVGNGLYVILEHLISGASEDPFGWDEDAHVSAYMLSYPIGLFDSIQAIGYYAWDEEEYSQHLSWQRTYDNLVIDVSLFRYPDTTAHADDSSQSAARSGYGGQLMLIYYH